jgi:hypothetical protein
MLSESNLTSQRNPVIHIPYIGQWSARTWLADLKRYLTIDQGFQKRVLRYYKTFHKPHNMNIFLNQWAG